MRGWLFPFSLLERLSRSWEGIELVGAQLAFSNDGLLSRTLVVDTALGRSRHRTDPTTLVIARSGPRRRDPSLQTQRSPSRPNVGCPRPEPGS